MSPGNRPNGTLARPSNMSAIPATMAIAPTSTNSFPRSLIPAQSKPSPDATAVPLCPPWLMLKSRPMKLRQLFFLLLVSPVLAAVLAAAQTAPPIIEITAEPNHHLMFENQYVRVFKVDLAPHASMLMHHHRHDYIFVALGPAEIENDVAGKPPVVRKLQEGETSFVSGGFAHFAKNLTDRPFVVVAVELLRTGPAQISHKWDEDRGLHILNGGTQDILFVKDGVRATDLQLNPGGVVPKHHHHGPHVVVAVTDLDLRSDVDGKGASKVELKAGDAAWSKRRRHSHRNQRRQAKRQADHVGTTLTFPTVVSRAKAKDLVLPKRIPPCAFRRSSDINNSPRAVCG